jgi:antitoxin (DNA-binding transcriptional repressor) of toxin-antitoxin stability system
MGMERITLREAQKRLPELVRALSTERELLIVDADQPVPRLVAPQRTSLRDIAPSAIGRLLRPFPDIEDDLLREMLDPADDRS